MKLNRQTKLFFQRGTLFEPGQDSLVLIASANTKAQTSLRMRVVSLEPLRLANIKHGHREAGLGQRTRPQFPNMVLHGGFLSIREKYPTVMFWRMVLGHFGHGHFGLGRFGPGISATDVSATENAKGGRFGHNHKMWVGYGIKYYIK